MSTNKINIEAVNARACQEKTPMTKIPSVEERVDWEAKFEIEFSHIKSTNKHIPAQIDTRDYKDIKNFITTLLTAEREAGREEERANIPVSFLRQWINEDIKQPHQELVTNEDIMRFINIGYGK